MKTIVLTLFLMNVSFLASAQERELKDSIQELLSSPSMAVKAWGAYITAKHEVREIIPDLWAQLIYLEGGKTHEVRYLRYAILDALIQLKAKPDLNALEVLGSRYNSHKFLLLVNNLDQNQDQLVKLVRGPRVSRACYIAVCNLLAPKKSPGLTLFLLEKLNLKLKVSVVTGDKHIGFGGRSSSAGDGAFKVPEDFPPITMYHLKEGTLTPFFKNYHLIAPGKKPVYCSRRLVQPGKTAGFGSVGARGLINKDVLDYLTQVRNNKISFKPEQSRCFSWVDGEKLKNDVKAHQDKMLLEIKALAAALQSEGLLTKEELKGYRPKIQLEVRDSRDDKTTPLPEFN